MAAGNPIPIDTLLQFDAGATQALQNHRPTTTCLARRIGASDELHTANSLTQTTMWATTAAGAYLGGHTTAETFFEILDRANAYADEDWRELSRALRFDRPDEFYLFEADPDTGLSSDEVTLQELFTYRQIGVTPEGNAFGYHAATGAIPVHLDHLIASGEDLPTSLFEATPLPPKQELY